MNLENQLETLLAGTHDLRLHVINRVTSENHGPEERRYQEALISLLLSCDAEIALMRSYLKSQTGGGRHKDAQPCSEHGVKMPDFDMAVVSCSNLLKAAKGDHAAYQAAQDALRADGFEYVMQRDAWVKQN